jgi:hypothetical protein
MAADNEVLEAMISWGHRQMYQHGAAPLSEVLRVEGIEVDDLRLIHGNFPLLMRELVGIEPDPFDAFALGLMVGMELQRLRDAEG